MNRKSINRKTKSAKSDIDLQPMYLQISFLFFLLHGDKIDVLLIENSNYRHDIFVLGALNDKCNTSKTNGTKMKYFFS